MWRKPLIDAVSALPESNEQLDLFCPWCCGVLIWTSWLSYRLTKWSLSLKITFKHRLQFDCVCVCCLKKRNQEKSVFMLICFRPHIIVARICTQKPEWKRKIQKRAEMMKKAWMMVLCWNRLVVLPVTLRNLFLLLLVHSQIQEKNRKEQKQIFLYNYRSTGLWSFTAFWFHERTWLLAALQCIQDVYYDVHSRRNISNINRQNNFKLRRCHVEISK